MTTLMMMMIDEASMTGMAMHQRALVSSHAGALSYPQLLSAQRSNIVGTRILMGAAQIVASQQKCQRNGSLPYLQKALPVTALGNIHLNKSQNDWSCFQVRAW